MSGLQRGSQLQWRLLQRSVTTGWSRSYLRPFSVTNGRTAEADGSSGNKSVSSSTPPNVSSTSSTGPSTGSSSSGSQHMHTERQIVPSGWDKFCLVSAGTYKSKNEIPATVGFSKIERAQSVTRIKINLLIGLVCIIGSVIAVYLGKSAQKRKETLDGRVLAWHDQLREENRREQGSKK